MRTLHNFKALNSNSGILMFFVNLFTARIKLSWDDIALTVKHILHVSYPCVCLCGEILFDFLKNVFVLSHVSLVLLQTRVVFVQGLPQNATEDTVLNYFENSRRSGGGAVEEVKIKGNVARVLFESTEGNCIAYIAV